MHEDLRAGIGFWLRLLSGGLLMALGVGLLRTDSGGSPAVLQLLSALAVFMLAAVLLAGPVAGLLASGTGSLFFPDRRFDRPQPLYSIPESRRKEGLVQEAWDGFEHLAETYPQELRPYVELMDIAAVDLHDAARLETVYRQGMETLRRARDRTVLHTMHEAIRSRMTVRPPPGQVHMDPDRAGSRGPAEVPSPPT